MRSLFSHRRSSSYGWLSVLSVSFLFSCPFHGRSQVLPFEFYTTATGLLSDGATTLYQDSDGYLHVGSSEGLSTFDGYSFSYTRTREGLPSNFINTIT